MKTLKSHLEMHARFRNGIFLLAALLTIIVLIVYLYPYKQQNFKTNELAEFHNTVDSLRKIISTCTVSYAIKPFNPNFISDYKGYQLGLSAKEVDRIRDYRNQNKWINSISDFKNVTKISYKRLQKISPLFKFPKWVQKKNSQRKRYSTRHLSFYQKIDLNKATVAQLQEKVMIPDFIAKRIIRYREKIGGFVNDIQLKDVVGLYEHQRRKLVGFFTVKTPQKITKINVNTATVNELLEIPYFDFETTLEIRDYIKANGPIKNIEELGKINHFYLEKIGRIALYLTVN